MDISDAMFLDETIANSFVISSQVFPDLVNTSDWFVSVTTFDDDEVRRLWTPRKSTLLMHLARLPMTQALETIWNRC